jgi:uncharacterized protein (TIGR03437 family)
MLYVAGGNPVGNGVPRLTTTDAYNADTNSWITGLGTMPHGVTNPGSASVGGRLYCFGGADTGGNQQGNTYVQIYQPGSQPPAISNVISATPFGGFTAIAPGSLIEIYGTNLAGDSRGWTSADFNGANAPTSLDGTTVTIAGQAAFVDYISPTEVDAQVPSGVPAGQQQIVVTASNGSSAAYTVTANPTEPGLFAPSSLDIGGMQYVGALFADSLAPVLTPGDVTSFASQRAQPGDTIVLSGVGFGPVVPDSPAGQIVQQANTLATPLQVSFGGMPATVVSSGLVPGNIGLYQFNVVVPNVAASDAIPVIFTLGGVAGTQTLYIAVQN